MNNNTQEHDHKWETHRPSPERTHYRSWLLWSTTKDWSLRSFSLGSLQWNKSRDQRWWTWWVWRFRISGLSWVSDCWVSDRWVVDRWVSNRWVVNRWVSDDWVLCWFKLILCWFLGKIRESYSFFSSIFFGARNFGFRV